MVLGLGLILGFGATGCIDVPEPTETAGDGDSEADPDPDSDSAGNTNPGPGNTTQDPATSQSGGNTQGNDSAGDPTTYGEASTYAGPDETDSWWDSDNYDTEVAGTTGGTTDTDTDTYGSTTMGETSTGGTTIGEDSEG
ncbi:MAG: hypothetical protein AAF799_32680 [Myxococcota bacterium]